MLDKAAQVYAYATVLYHEDKDGYIVWRRGTGMNVELLHIKAVQPGGGRRLLRVMLQKLLESPPYATVFGFSRSCNDTAHEFYIQNGFVLSGVQGVYQDGTAVLFSQDYTTLCELHQICR